MPKVSVIVPVYGVEKYIEQCVRCLMEQTLEDMEFVFVDDATKDDSMNILDRTLADYPARKSQVKILHHEVNKGLPAARRTGLSAATGEYIIHCDSDDWMDRDMYRAMYEKAVSDDLDLVVCDFYRDPDKGIVWRQYDSPDTDYISDLILFRSTMCVWNKLVRKSSIDWDTFIWAEEFMGEDLPTAIQFAWYCKRIGYVHTPLYYYRQRTDNTSDTSEKVIPLIRQFRRNFGKSLSFLKEKGVVDKYTDEIAHRALNIKNRYLPYLNEDGIYLEWKETCSEYNNAILTASSVSLREKLIYLATMFRVYGLIRKIIK